MTFRVALSVVVLLSAALTASAVTHVVDVGGTGDYTTIRTAVDAASDGDTVLVLPGSYTGINNRFIRFYGDNLVVRSSTGAVSTTIDGEGDGPIFDLRDGEDPTSVIQGFTMQNAYKYTNGGALVCHTASATVMDCIFDDCSSGLNGGAVSCYECTTAIENCVFTGCGAGGHAGAIYAYRAPVRVSGCVFYDNASPQDVVYLNDSPGTVTRCTFSHNGPEAIGIGSATTATVTNCVFAFASSGGAVRCQGSGDLQISHCVVWANAGGDSLCATYHDNLFVDPLFCDGPGYDYTYCADSPCVAGINGWGEWVGALGQGCPPCAPAVEQSSWGAVKALYR